VVVVGWVKSTFLQFRCDKGNKLETDTIAFTSRLNQITVKDEGVYRIGQLK
jgi:hypothetical protein